MHITTQAPARATVALPYFHVRRLPTGIYAVAHRVPGTDCHHVDAEATSMQGAMRLCAEMEATRRAAAA
jgi:hypothetical protein